MTTPSRRPGISSIVFVALLVVLFATVQPRVAGGETPAHSSVTASSHGPSPAASTEVTKQSASESSRGSSPGSSREVTTKSDAASNRGPNPIVVPPYRAEIRAAHRVHAEQAKMLCTDCHARATSSQNAKDFLGPAASVCERCHDVRHDELATDGDPRGGDCVSCHLERAHLAGATSAGQLERRPTAHIEFSHAAHARHAIGCGQCHGQVAKRNDADGSERLPREPICVRCHRGQGARDGGARSACTTCHESEAGRMRTHFGSARLLPRSSIAIEHGPQFRFTHGAVAGNDPKVCESCHHPRECQACHDGQLRPRSIHPSDWMAMHAIASKQGNDCGSCHRLQSFCLSCHQRVGVVASGAPRSIAERGNVHPPASVWLTGPRGERHHGVLARRNLAECVSCHQERDCIRCHAAGALGTTSTSSVSVNPHPPGFVANCRASWQRNPRPCLACHRPEGSELGLCR
ncbi:MAG: cytochrome c3 family protein [Polyangiaceae bacterium]